MVYSVKSSGISLSFTVTVDQPCIRLSKHPFTCSTMYNLCSTNPLCTEIYAIIDPGLTSRSVVLFADFFIILECIVFFYFFVFGKCFIAFKPMCLQYAVHCVCCLIMCSLKHLNICFIINHWIKIWAHSCRTHSFWSGSHTDICPQVLANLLLNILLCVAYIGNFAYITFVLEMFRRK